MPDLEADGLQQHQTTSSFSQEEQSEATLGTGSYKLDNWELEKQLDLSIFSELKYLMFNTVYTVAKLCINFHFYLCLCCKK